MIVSGALALVMGIGGIVYDAVVLSYHPLEQGSSGSARGDSLRVQGVRRDSTVFLGGPGKSFSIIIQWRNAGSRSVKITGLPAPFSPYVVEPRGVFVSEPSIVPELHGPRRRFTPFALPPGDSVTVEYRFRFAECETQVPAAPVVDGSSVRLPGDGWGSVRSFRVEYEVFGVSRTVLIEPRDDYAIATTGSACHGLRPVAEANAS